MTLRRVSELSGEDNNLFGLGGARWFAPGERGGDIMSGGAVAFGNAAAAGAGGGPPGGREGSMIELLLL